MTQNHDKLFAKRLNLIRFAFGFRDHKHFRAGAKSTGIDLGQGHFADLFRKYSCGNWDKFTVPEGWSRSEDIAQSAPTDTTITRWLRGESHPSRKQLPGIVAVLNAILSDARADDAFLGTKHVEDTFLIKPKFVFDVKNVDPEETAGRHFAEAMVFDITLFDNWWKDASGPSVESKLNVMERTFLGIYFVYRLYAEKNAAMQQDVLVVYQNEARDGLRALLVGSTEIPWRGDITLGRSTVSALLRREGDLIGTQINIMSLAHRGGAELMHGFRTRIVHGAEFNIAAYRVILSKRNDVAHEKYLEDDLDNDQVAMSLMSSSKLISDRDYSSDPQLQLIRDALLATQPKFPEFELDERRSHNIFGLPKELTNPGDSDSENQSVA